MYYLIVMFFSFFMMTSVTAEVVSGNPNGKITIVEYFDYNCPHCRTMSDVLDDFEDDPQVRISRRVLAIMSGDSWFAAKAVLAAQKQGLDKYQKLNELLVSQHRSISEEVVMECANEAGLDLDLLARQMENPSIIQEIKDNMRQYHALGIHIVPTTLIMRSDDQRTAQTFTGKISASKIKAVIADLL